MTFNKTATVARTRRALPSLVRLYLEIFHKDARRRSVKPRFTARQRAIAEDVVVQTAFHEAGHAVMLRHALGTFPLLVTIERGSELLEPGWGFTRRPETFLHRLGDELKTGLRTAPPELRAHIRRDVEAEVLFSLAGEAVDAMHEQGDDRRSLHERLDEAFGLGEGTDDFGQAFAMVAHFEENERRRWRRLVRLATKTEKIVRIPRITMAIRSVAEALLDKPTLYEPELVVLLEPVPRPRALRSS